MAPYRFAPQQQPARPVVEIRTPEFRVSDPAPPPTNSMGQTVGVLAQALADRQMKQEAAAKAADPWNGLREPEPQSPFAALNQRLGQLFGPRF